ncbi:hypothetical protein M3Y99_00318400 [Aphelenchoides fujianensis]|nr:hypothetical protein M3Y99_00318400 [Aphelenchoides fujianensis]
MKAFATSVSIVVGALVATVFFSDPPKPFFFAGTPLVIGAVVLYSIPWKTLLFCRRTEWNERLYIFIA